MRRREQIKELVGLKSYMMLIPAIKKCEENDKIIVYHATNNLGLIANRDEIEKIYLNLKIFTTEEWIRFLKNKQTEQRVKEAKWLT